MKSGFGGQLFPELDLILQEERKTIIFCRAINLGFRVFAYLHYLSLDHYPDVNVTKMIRLYNALVQVQRGNMEAHCRKNDVNLCLWR